MTLGLFVKLSIVFEFFANFLDEFALGNPASTTTLDKELLLDRQARLAAFDFLLLALLLMWNGTNCSFLEADKPGRMADLAAIIDNMDDSPFHYYGELY